MRGSFFTSKIVKTSLPIVVAGNGPSLSKGLMWIKSKGIKADIAATNFYLLDNKLPLPKYYFLTDDRFFGNKSKLSIGSKILEDEVSNKIILFFKRINNFEKNLILFVPKKHFKIVKYKIKNDKILIKSININSFDSWLALRNYFYNKKLAVPMAQTVLISALFYSVHMSKNVYLAGCDSNWLDELRVNKENIVRTNLKHNDGSNIEITYPSMRLALETQVNVFKSYEYISHWSKTINTEIINLTQNSYIDIFKKIK